MKKFDVLSLTENSAKLIGNDWLLISAGSRDKFNTMTASWGAFGFMWNKPAFFVFARPTRYTYQFMEARDEFTVCVLPESERNALKICGTKSGRDCDKSPSQASPPNSPKTATRTSPSPAWSSSAARRIRR